VPDAPALFDPPVTLTQAHDGAAFDAGEPVLDEWLRRRAWSNQQAAASRTYLAEMTARQGPRRVGRQDRGYGAGASGPGAHGASIDAEARRRGVTRSAFLANAARENGG
jgi:hypothetical protein